jgi:hypothetical protein
MVAPTGSQHSEAVAFMKLYARHVQDVDLRSDVHDDEYRYSILLPFLLFYTNFHSLLFTG